MEKKNYLWSMLVFVIAAMLCVFSSCGSEDDPELSISSPTTLSLYLQANGDGDKTITVSASHTDWSADVSYVNGSDWLTLGSKNGASISFTVKENKTTSSRKAIIKITATADASLSKEVTVTQAGGESFITVSQPSMDFNVDGGSQTIQVTSNTAWNLSGNDSWLTVNPSSGAEPSSGSETKAVTITAKENATNDSQTCTLTFTTSDGKANAMVTVTQRGLTDVWAEPSEELLMCYSYAHAISCGAKTKYFYIGLYSKSLYELKSEREIIKDVATGKVEDRQKPDSENFYSWDKLSENSSYVLAIVPYGENDRQGKLFTKQFKTKKSDSEPDVSITNFSIDWDTDSYLWNVAKNTYCSSYYTYAVSSKYYFPTFYWMEKERYGLIAWPLRAEIEKDNSNHRAYINEDAWKKWAKEDPGNAEVYKSYSATEKFYAQQINDGVSSFSANPRTDKYFQIILWGTKSNGDLSGIFSFAYGDWSGATSVNRSRAVAVPNTLKETEKKDEKLKFFCGNLKDFDIIRIK